MENEQENWRSPRSSRQSVDLANQGGNVIRSWCYPMGSKVIPTLWKEVQWTKAQKLALSEEALTLWGSGLITLEASTRAPQGLLAC